MCVCQTDLVDQNLLNFLPIGEHSDVYKALSTHPSDPESLNTDFMKSKSFILTHRPHSYIFKHFQMVFNKCEKLFALSEQWL